MKPIIIISFLLIGFSARPQSPQAARLFNFDFEKQLITIDTVVRFEGLSKKKIIDLRQENKQFRDVHFPRSNKQF